MSRCLAPLICVLLIPWPPTRSRPLDDAAHLDDPPGPRPIDSVQDGFLLGPSINLSVARHAFDSLKPHSETPEVVIPASEHRLHYPFHPSKLPGGEERLKDKQVLLSRNQVLTQISSHGNMRQQQTCKGQKFRQTVKWPGCLSKIVVNRFCAGTCSSYFIPKMRAKKLKASFKSCSTCAPYEYDMFNVTLECPGQEPAFVTRPIVKCQNVDLTDSAWGL